MIMKILSRELLRTLCQTIFHCLVNVENVQEKMFVYVENINYLVASIAAVSLILVKILMSKIFIHVV